MELLRKIDKYLNLIRIVAICAILIFAVSICTVNIVLRYIVRSSSGFRPFPWVNEILQLSGVWIGFLAAGLGVKSNAHVSLESIIASKVPAKIYKPMKKILQLIVLVTLLVLIYFGIKTTIFEKPSFLQNLHMSNAWFYAAIPVGCFYLFYDYLLIFIFGEHPFAKKKEEKAEETSGAF